jgi:hypothetical protein
MEVSVPDSRVSGAAGIGFVLTVVTANAFLQPAGVPAADASPAKVAAFFTDHATQIAVSSALAPLAWVLLAVFGAGAIARLWRGEQDHGDAWSLVGLAGLVMQNVVFAGVIATQVALLAEPSAGGGMWRLHNALFTLNGMSLATAMVGLSLAGRRTGVIRPWHAAVGLLGAALQGLWATLTPVAVDTAPAEVAAIGLLGFLLWLVWLATFGAVLLRRRPHATSPVPGTGAHVPTAS